MAEKRRTQAVYYPSPDWKKMKKDNKQFRTEFWKAFSHAHYELSSIELKKHAIRYIKSNTKLDYTVLNDVHECKFETLGKLCFIRNHEGDLIEEGYKNLEKLINDVIQYGIGLQKEKLRKKEEEKQKEQVTEVVSIQDRLKEHRYVGWNSL